MISMQQLNVFTFIIFIRMSRAKRWIKLENFLIDNFPLLFESRTTKWNFSSTHSISFLKTTAHDTLDQLSCSCSFLSCSFWWIVVAAAGFEKRLRKENLSFGFSLLDFVCVHAADDVVISLRYPKDSQRDKKKEARKFFFSFQHQRKLKAMIFSDNSHIIASSIVFQTLWEEKFQVYFQKEKGDEKKPKLCLVPSLCELLIKSHQEKINCPTHFIVNDARHNEKLSRMSLLIAGERMRCHRNHHPI